MFTRNELTPIFFTALLLGFLTGSARSWAQPEEPGRNGFEVNPTMTFRTIADCESVRSRIQEIVKLQYHYEVRRADLLVQLFGNQRPVDLQLVCEPKLGTRYTQLSGSASARWDDLALRYRGRWEAASALYNHLDFAKLPGRTKMQKCENSPEYGFIRQLAFSPDSRNLRRLVIQASCNDLGELKAGFSAQRGHGLVPRSERAGFTPVTPGDPRSFNGPMANGPMAKDAKGPIEPAGFGPGSFKEGSAVRVGTRTGTFE